MKKPNYIRLNMENWNRKEHFDFFSGFDEPFFSVVADVDCTAAYEFAKENELSFFSVYLHRSLLAANQITEFRYRIEEKQVLVYDEVHASPTIGREDGTFGFSLIPFSDNFYTFNESVIAETDAVRQSSGLRLNDQTGRTDVIHYSSLPWIKFTGISHARHFGIKDSCPKISFGKMIEVNGRKQMPVSVAVHHGLADGVHVAAFFELYQQHLDQK